MKDTVRSQLDAEGWTAASVKSTSNTMLAKWEITLKLFHSGQSKQRAYCRFGWLITDYPQNLQSLRRQASGQAWEELSMLVDWGGKSYPNCGPFHGQDSQRRNWAGTRHSRHPGCRRILHLLPCFPSRARLCSWELSIKINLSSPLIWFLSNILSLKKWINMTMLGVDYLIHGPELSSAVYAEEVRAEMRLKAWTLALLLTAVWL